MRIAHYKNNYFKMRRVIYVYHDLEVVGQNIQILHLLI